MLASSAGNSLGKILQDYAFLFFRIFIFNYPSGFLTIPNLFRNLVAGCVILQILPKELPAEEAILLCYIYVWSTLFHRLKEEIACKIAAKNRPCRAALRN